MLWCKLFACHSSRHAELPARRFLARLLLVHGSLSHYRLARLIKYSFYKNILFCFVLFFFQFYCGFSGAHHCCLLAQNATRLFVAAMQCELRCNIRVCMRMRLW